MKSKITFSDWLQKKKDKPKEHIQTAPPDNQNIILKLAKALGFNVDLDIDDSIEKHSK